MTPLPFGGQTLVDLLRMRADTTPDDRAYVFLRDGEIEDAVLTWAELDRRSRALATRIAASAPSGSRGLIVCPAGLEFVVAFFACLRAGVIAVPAPMPTASRRTADSRLAGMIEDCTPVLVLTTRSGAPRVSASCDAVGIAEGGARLVITDDEPAGSASSTARAESCRDRAVGADTVAFLQYTSGSTSSPRGVMITHANLLANLAAAFRMASRAPVPASVSWLPVTHDMGLIEGLLQPAYRGHAAVLMSPTAFLQRPVRWLRAISRYRATRSGGPNFAYDLCVRRVNPDDIADLDLACWRDAYNGAEPVRADTMAAFVDLFGRAGFDAAAFRPCYGLAEATLLVATARWARPPAQGLSNLVSCGATAPGVDLCVVDPGTATVCAPGTIGEIWIAGPSVSKGYWQREIETRTIFGARTSDGCGPFLRTGDLGRVADGALTITGRLKDVLIVRGHKLFPQDLEHTAAGAHPAVRPAAVSAVATSADAAGDRIGVAAEIDPRRATTTGETDAIIAAIRVAVQEAHGVQLDAVALVAPGGVPRTTSGKVQRYLCLRGWTTGGLPMLAEWRRPATA